MTFNNFIYRALWLIPVILLSAGIVWLDQNRGGDLERHFACILTNSKLAGVDDDIIIFGSSRSINSFDTDYINEIFSHEDLPVDFNIARYALNAKDNVSAYFLLKNRIDNGLAPKLIALELMFGSGTNKVREDILKPRHSALLSFQQQYSRMKDFNHTSRPKAWLEYLKALLDRSNALIYGLIKHPSSHYWNPESCTTTKDWGNKNSASGEHHATGNAEDEVKRANEILSSGYDLAFQKMASPKSKWSAHHKNYQKNLKQNKNSQTFDISPIYNLDKIVTKYERKDFRKIINLAKKNNITVILVAMTRYPQALEETEYQLLQEHFPEATVYDIFAEARPTINAYWRDYSHVSKQGSMLMSALLGRKIVQEIKHD